MRNIMGFLTLFMAVLLLATTGYSDPWKEKISQSETLDYIRKYLRKRNVYGFGHFIPSADPDNHIYKKDEWELVDWDVDIDEDSFKLFADVRQENVKKNRAQDIHTLKMQFDTKDLHYAEIYDKSRNIVKIRAKGEIEAVERYLYKKGRERPKLHKEWDRQDGKIYVVMRDRTIAKRLVKAINYYAYNWGSSTKKDPFDD